MMDTSRGRAAERLAVLGAQLAGGQARAMSAVPEATAVCGIVGYVGPGDACGVLLEGLQILQNRGYDSVGMSTIGGGKELVTTKFASGAATNDAMDKLARAAPQAHKQHHIGIGHTRWATHGGKTDANAHPHTDEAGRVSLIHNGIIGNAEDIKAELLDAGVTFSSETDSEVVAQLIGRLVAKGMPLVDAVKEATARLQGTWGLLVLDREDPSQIVAAKNGSPILIGIGQKQMFLASEAAAFARHTKEFIALDDGEIAVVHADRHTLDVSRVKTAEIEDVATSPHPFPKWTIKEIMDQPEAVSKALNYGGRILGEEGAKLGGLDGRKDLMLGITNLVIAACGTSLFAGRFGAKMMYALQCFNSITVVDASELTRDMFPKEGAGLLVISQSGETADVYSALMLAEDLGVPTFSVVNVVRSLVARTTACGVYLNAGRENAVASTKAFTCQATVLSLIALWFSHHRSRERRQRRSLLVDALHRLPTNIGMTLHSMRDPCRRIAERMRDATRCFVLGKGFGEPIAHEGALKIKEITYVHAEGFAGGALKHGPFALLEAGTPVIAILLADGNESRMENVLQQVRARDAFTVCITNVRGNESLADETLLIPSNGPLTALLAVLPMQLIAYELAVLRGIDPDFPRHLAKTVTVH